jgi:hypothetical protein
MLPESKSGLGEYWFLNHLGAARESKIGRKRRKKVEFDLTLLEGKARRWGIRLTPAKSRRKKSRENSSSV